MFVDDIPRYIKIGAKDKNWYAECQKVFEDLFGKERLRLVTSLFAATSINTSLKSNITLFRKALYEMENDLPIGRYLPNIRNQLQRIRDGQPLSGQKIESFRRAMSGDVDAVVVDTWMLRAFKVDKEYFRQRKGAAPGVGMMRSAGTSEKMYLKIEAWVREYAKANKYEAREVQSMIWSGKRIEKSGDRETHYKTILINKLTNLFGVI